jgi:phosphopantothenoylcysteine decarboxylase
MANVLLGVTGSVAAIKTLELFDDLKSRGNAVKVVATRSALYFFDPLALDPLQANDGPRRNPAVVALDEDEWPGEQYQRQDTVLHIELRRWAELFVIAPLDANTLAKLATGLCDNCLTCVWRAWEPGRPVLLAPAMNTLMWQHPFTARHLRQLAAAAGAAGAPLHLPPDDLPDWINAHCPHLRIAAPVNKRLACDDVGVGAMAEVETITSFVDALLKTD